MTVRPVPLDHFPWKSHRTLAEVAETERLAAQVRGAIGGDPQVHRRLRDLLAKAVAANPSRAA